MVIQNVSSGSKTLQVFGSDNKMIQVKASGLKVLKNHDEINLLQKRKMLFSISAAFLLLISAKLLLIPAFAIILSKGFFTVLEVITIK